MVSYSNGNDTFVPNTLSIVDNMRVLGGENERITVYPNPASTNANFSFSLQQDGRVRIILFDALGNEKASVLNEILSKGYHERNIDLSTFPSGQYIYTINLGSEIITNKLVIIK